MARDLTALRNARYDQALLTRIEGAVIEVSQAIRNENAATANHANRLAWTELVAQDTEKQAKRAQIMVLLDTNMYNAWVNTGITNLQKDNAIYSAVLSVADKLAEVG